MPTKSKSTKRRVKIEDTPKQMKKLSKDDQKKVRGGILPYIEQDNLHRVANISDGTSNTLLNKK
jgi:hypothetical protein